MPDRFFVVGAQRSGTTYLHRVLDEHPGIVMAQPVWPEPKFFSDGEQFARGIGWYDATYFHGADATLVWGDKSVGYLESENAATRIAATVPSARIVAVLRNPVDRAVSNFRFSVGHGLETLPIEEALTADEEARVERDGDWFVVAGRRIGASPFAYRRRGHYVVDLRRYARLFGRERMHVLVFENAVGSPLALRALYSFLGVEPEFAAPSAATIVNRADADADDAALPDALRRRLEDEFALDNAALAAEFALDLSAWDPAPSGSTLSAPPPSR